jgi:hypothetical protein
MIALCFFAGPHGQAAFHLVRSEQKLVLSLAQRLEELGKARNNAAKVDLGRDIRCIEETRWGQPLSTG